MPGEDVITRFDNAGVEISLMIEGGTPLQATCYDSSTC